MRKKITSTYLLALALASCLAACKSPVTKNTNAGEVAAAPAKTDTPAGPKKSEAPVEAEKPAKTGFRLPWQKKVKSEETSAAVVKAVSPEKSEPAPAEAKKSRFRLPWQKKEKVDEPISPATLTPTTEEASVATATTKKGFQWPWQKRGESTSGGPAAAEDEKARATREGGEAAFLAECARCGEAGGTITGKDGYTFSAAELKQISRLGSASYNSAVSAISDYSSQLKAKGIDLIVVPVPPKAVLYPDYLSKELKLPGKRKKPVRVDSFFVKANAALKSRGVKVVDLAPDFFEKRFDKKAGGIYPRAGERWAPRAAQWAAHEAANLTSAKRGRVDGLSGADAVIHFGGENLAARFVTLNGSTPSFGSGGSPVVVIGDAMAASWRGAGNPAGFEGGAASFADQLSLELSSKVDLHYSDDPRNNARVKIMRAATQGRSPLSGAKVVVWCFDALELAKSGWQQVPLRLQFVEIQPTLDIR